MSNKTINFMETVLRDAHQSLMATRMSTEDMLPIVEKLDQAGYTSLECWGGATYDAAIRFLNEDPWQRLREIRKRAKNTKLQMLLRGQNLLGYRNYADDVVESFVANAAEAGIDIFRIFDALNDTRNLKTSLKAVKKANKHAQLVMCYTISTVHTVEYYSKLAQELVDMGADSICVKDMAGIMTPEVAKELVTELKKVTDIPIEIHTHATSGTSEMTYLASVEAGADIIDTAISPFASGTSQPASETMAYVLKEYGYNLNVDLDAMEEVAEYFKPIKQKYIDEGIFDYKMMDVEPKALFYQVPGGMLSNLYSQLKQANATDKYDEVLKEVPAVRKDLGYPPLVTPMSQMVGTQAVFNVIAKERYKMVPNEIKSYLRGEYGQSPAPVDETVRKNIIGDETVMTDRPADHLEPEMESLAAELGDLAKTEEDVLTYALFPQVGLTYLKNKYSNKPADGKEDDITKIKVTQI
ncbi:oxaloacetate decarboxylase subunit alpha [Tetragenococcus halophilus]|uniref:oxaloacetate decarboxylase subunit alpha n=1 Tax=Tetragenococcus halophilus TaxID=51669 RepID=UPI0020954CB9|nr:oxaloacetate decarboxylase subunit alpha [Tetragenococcus halophilus]MCO7026017.1 oxaloacetate decarboxylase subunit alpha [Tetragenococcus halophilus]MCO8287535.1 oxaloacetate decarboxylase subunit alpha [Tetragenococcus halophilus]MCO8292600.1 oxaloacetate decarboxylase subunit alpha [Tetragenococcus halophilus]WJS81394.1 oxaloacetate decarboxylase subunit alpha [Tetragenococcus halophilus]GMG70232.1 oxaloacetate decarboxylase subunit alpha [Tetragenococcus halophilus]